MRYLGLYLFLLACVALLFGGKPAYTLFYAFLLVYFGARKLVHLAFSRLQVERHLDQTHIFPGESAKITVRFHNRSLVPLVWLMSKDSLDIELGAGFQQRVVSLLPASQAEWTYEIKARRRGMHALGPMGLVTGDPFGLYSESGVYNKRDYVVVYPHIRALTEFGLPSRVPIGQVKTPVRIFEDPTRTIGVREYAPGDRMRRIHWNATAKSGRLMVKCYQPTIMVDTMMFINMRYEDYDVAELAISPELAIEMAASLATHLSERGISVGFASNGVIPAVVFERNLMDEDVAIYEGGLEHLDASTAEVTLAREEKRKGASAIRLLPRKGRGQLMRVLEILSVLDVDQREQPFADFLRRGVSGLAMGTTILAVTPADTDELIDQCYALVREGYTVLVFVIGFRVRHPHLLHRNQGALRLFRAQRSGRENRIEVS